MRSLPSTEATPRRGVDTYGDPSLPDSVHVDDLIQILDIRSHEILLMCLRRLYRRGQRRSLDLASLAGE